MKKLTTMMISCLAYTSVSYANNITNIETLGCLLAPSQTIDVSSPIASVIDDIPVKRGQKIKQGQLLFQLRSGIESANVDLAQVKADFAKRNASRNEELFGDDLLSSHERDEIETEKQVAAMELKVKQEELAMRSVYSMVDGVVIERHNNAGEYVSTKPVVAVAVLDPLYVDVLMPFERFNDFKKHDRLTVTLPSPVNSQHQANIIIIDPIIDSASGTFRMRLELANHDYSIPAGISCQLTLAQQSE